MVLTPEQTQRLYSRRYREEHAEEIQVWKDACTEEERQARRNKKAAQAKARRKKERLENPRQKHVVSQRNKHRNEKVRQRKAQTSTFNERAKLQQRMQRV